jgi:tRNA(Ile)-lysidine synthase
VAKALARTATQLQEDLDVLDGQALGLLAAASRTPEPDPDAVADSGAADLDVAELAQAPAALRRRVLRRWLLGAGVAELTDAHLRAADDLIGRWSGQGALRLPGDVELVRAHGRLHATR